MSDLTFETQLARQLRAYAEGGVRPVNRFVVAEEAIAAGRTRSHRGRGLGSLRGNRALVPLLVGLLLAALAGGALVVGSRLLAPSHPILGVLEPAGSMPIHATGAVVLPDGRVVVAGSSTRPRGASWRPGRCRGPASKGSRPRSSGMAGSWSRAGIGWGTAEMYDPGTGTFAMTGRMRANRTNPTVTLLRDGRVLLAGGCLTLACPGSSVLEATDGDIYDPSSGTFSPTSPMQRPRVGHVAALLRAGRVLIAGGVPGPGSIVHLRSAEIFDPASGTFQPTGPLTDAHAGAGAAVLPSGDVLVFGDRNLFIPSGSTVKTPTAEVFR